MEMTKKEGMKIFLVRAIRLSRASMTTTRERNRDDDTEGEKNIKNHSAN